MPTEIYVGRVRSVVLLILLTILTAGLWFFVWLIQINRDLQRHLKGGVNPWGRFFLFLLVPVIGWFLVAYMTGRSVRRVQLAAGSDRLVVPIYHGLWAALVPVLGWITAMGFLQRGANRAWLKYTSAFTGSAQTPATVECPDCSTQFTSVLSPLFPRLVKCPQCGRAGGI